MDARQTSSRGGAQQVSRTGEFDLPCQPDTAFPLFSPEGERRWIKEWNPQPVFPQTIEFRRETVFREGEAVWTIVDADLQAHRAEYVRVAPASHAAHIVVKIDPLGHERSRVVVSYTVTVFTEEPELLEAFSERAYAEKMQNWRRQIISYFESGGSR